MYLCIHGSMYSYVVSRDCRQGCRTNMQNSGSVVFHDNRLLLFQYKQQEKRTEADRKDFQTGCSDKYSVFRFLGNAVPAKRRLTAVIFKKRFKHKVDTEICSAE